MLSNKGAGVAGLIIFFFIVVIFLFFGFIVLNWKNSPFTNLSNTYESELINATGEYVNDYYNDLKDGESLIIKLDTLKKLKYVNLKSCYGYSIVNKGKKIMIEPYLRCDDYKSKGYDINNE